MQMADSTELKSMQAVDDLGCAKKYSVLSKFNSCPKIRCDGEAEERAAMWKVLLEKGEVLIRDEWVRCCSISEEVRNLQLE
jgi:hypothetical protein